MCANTPVKRYIVGTVQYSRVARCFGDRWQRLRGLTKSSADIFIFFIAQLHFEMSRESRVKLLGVVWKREEQLKKKNCPPNCFGSVGVKCSSARSPRRLARTRTRTRPAGLDQVDGSKEKRSRRAAKLTEPQRCYSPQAGFALPPGMCGDGLAEQQRSGKVRRLSSAWRPSGFKPLRAVGSTERGREQGGGGEKRVGGRRTRRCCCRENTRWQVKLGPLNDYLEKYHVLHLQK